jgi:hypothetical protein
MMTTIAVWLLLSVSGNGVAATIEQFPTSAECESTLHRIQQKIPWRVYMYCIPAKVVVHD